MENCLSGLGNIINFRVRNQQIIWENYHIPVGSVSFYSVGVSTRYVKKPPKGGKFMKILSGAGSLYTVLCQLIDEDREDWLDTLDAYYYLHVDKTSLPCLNLELNNGMKMEITFTDLISFRDSVRAVRDACTQAQFDGLKVHGEFIDIDTIKVQGNSSINEINGGRKLLADSSQEED